jgi:hypothetical protein
VNKSKEAKVKTTKKLEIKKVTLRDIDEPKLDAMAGGMTYIYGTRAGMCTAGPQTFCTCELPTANSD